MTLWRRLISFGKLGLELEGRTTTEGEWAERATGLGDQRVEIAMMHVEIEYGHEKFFHVARHAV